MGGPGTRRSVEGVARQEEREEEEEAAVDQEGLLLPGRGPRCPPVAPSRGPSPPAGTTPRANRK